MSSHKSPLPRGNARMSTLTFRRIPGVAPDGTIIPERGPAIKKTKRIIIKKLLPQLNVVSKLKAGTTSSSTSSGDSSSGKSSGGAGSSDLKHTGASHHNSSLTLGSLQKLTPRQRHLAVNSEQTTQQTSPSCGSRRTSMLPNRTAPTSPVSLREHLTPTHGDGRGGENRRIRVSSLMEPVSEGGVLIREESNSPSVAVAAVDGSWEAAPNLFSTRQKSPKHHSLLTERSNGSVFASLMEKFQVDIRKVNAQSKKVHASRPNIVHLEHPITSCHSSTQLTEFSKNQAVKRRNIQGCKRRSSGFGMSMSCGDGRTSFMFTSQGPLEVAG